MLLKCCMQYVSKLWKCSSGHRTGKGQFSFQFQRKAMSKNVQTTMQLHSFHMLVILCPKSFKLGFSSTWTEDFQMYKLGLETAEKAEIKLPTSAGKAKQFQYIHISIYLSTYTYTFLLYWLCYNLWVCGSQQIVEYSWRDGNIRPPYLPPKKPVCRTGSNI